MVCWRRPYRLRAGTFPYLRPFPAHNGGILNAMQIEITQIQPWVALLAGMLILIMPRILNLVVAAYLIFVGAVGLLGRF